MPASRTALDRLRADRRAVFGVGVVVVLALAALLAPAIQHRDPLDIDLLARLQAPSGAHWLGTDAQGRDVWSRLVHGARVSLVVGLASQGVALLLYSFGI